MNGQAYNIMPPPINLARQRHKRQLIL